jgi:hypothetical protein
MGAKPRIAKNLEGLAIAAMALSIPERAVHFWGAATALRERTGAAIWPVDRLDYQRAIYAARVRFDPQRFAAAFAAGHDLPLEQVVVQATALAQDLIDASQ